GVAMELISGESRADDTATLSPRVYQLAQHVYKELESLRRLHGESSLGGLLPLNLKMLEEMDSLYNERRQLKIDLKLQVAEKNDVVFQLERAKKLHDTAVKRVNYLEDELLATKKEADEKVDKLEARIRHHEMLSRNAAEHAFRLEERAAQLQSELSTAQDRYTELLRAYVDQTERIRLTDADSVSQLTIRSSKAPVHAPQSDWDWKICGETAKTNSGEPKTPVHQRSDSPDQLDEDGFLKLNSLPTIGVMEEMKPADRVASFMDRMDETMEYESTIAPNSVAGQDTEDEEDAGIMREVEKLIAENTELSATKNALNVVKNDLISKLDTVSGEKRMLAKEVEYLRLSRDQTKAEANRLARQINTYQKQLSHLHTRLKQYEDVEDLLPLEVAGDLMTSQSNLQHAASCLTLTTTKSENHSLISPLERQAAALPGSLDCVVFNRVSAGMRPDDVKVTQKPEGFRMDYTGGSLASIQEVSYQFVDNH
ncbi:JNK-interacting protein, variant 2, partial [Clonorchis sinensis]